MRPRPVLLATVAVAIAGFGHFVDGLTISQAHAIRDSSIRYPAGLPLLPGPAACREVAGHGPAGSFVMAAYPLAHGDRAGGSRGLIRLRA